MLMLGRTGRAGRPGKAVTFFTESDSTYLRNIVQIMRNSGCEVPDYMLEMKKLRKKDSRLKKLPKRKSISTEPLVDKIKRQRKAKFARLAAGATDTAKEQQSAKKRKMSQWFQER